jgi:hypothetical protein
MFKIKGQPCTLVVLSSLCRRRFFRVIQSHVLFTAVLFFGAAHSHAAPKLLVEFMHSASPFELGIPTPTTIPFEILAGPRLRWREQYGPGDVGKTFFAPEEVVEGANLAVSVPNTAYLMETGPANFNSGPTVKRPLSECLPNDCVRLFVGQLDLTDYRVTSVERIVDQLVITPLGNEFYTLSATQRIHFFGELIPEPGTLALLLAALVSSTIFRRSRH